MTERQLIEQAAALARHYKPNKQVGATLGKKQLVMFVGPVATGKTYIMKRMVEAHPDFGLVTSFTTREQRPDDDPSMFRFLPHNQPSLRRILDTIEAGNAVQYAIHPTSHRFYGSESQDYSAKYNMLATLSGVVEPMSALPFEKTHCIGIVCRPAVWEVWLKKRFPVKNEDQQKRVTEAVQSLEWLLQTNLPVAWVENDPDATEQTIDDTLDAVLYNKTKALGEEVAKVMLKRAKELI
jgi:guanylate kinase